MTDTQGARFALTTEQLATALTNMGRVNARDFADELISAGELAEHLVQQFEPVTSLPLAVRAPEVGRLLDSIRAEIEDADGSWNGADVVELLTTWFPANGYDIG